MQTYDYVIIGAGSAGCVLAARLTEDPDVSVLLLEAGGRNDGVLVRMPAGVGELIKSKNASNWGFSTEPEPHLDNRRLWWPRGKGVGRQLVDQRHDLHAGPSAGLRRVAADGLARLVVRRRAAVFQAARGPSSR
uniref:lycopene cyclase family protein n=1 Tax=Sphingomonas sp. H160509 TaxID=2955313 RepID=UPI0031584C4C